MAFSTTKKGGGSFGLMIDYAMTGVLKCHSIKFFFGGDFFWKRRNHVPTEYLVFISHIHKIALLLMIDRVAKEYTDFNAGQCTYNLQLLVRE